MVRIVCTAIVCLVVDFADYRAAVEAESPKSAPLEGRWHIVSVHRDGEMDMTAPGATLTFAGDTVRFDAGHFYYIGCGYRTFSGPPPGSIVTALQRNPAILDGTS